MRLASIVPLWVGAIALAYTLAGAQVTPNQRRHELGVELLRWRLDGGSGSAAPTGVTGLALHARRLTGARTALEVSISHAPEDRRELDPGVTAAEASLVASVARLAAPEPGPSLTFIMGVTGLHFDARALEAALRECTPENFCLFEGVSYRTGWRAALVGGLLVELPLAVAVPLRLRGDLVKGIVGEGGSSPDLHLRLGAGLAWRF